MYVAILHTTMAAVDMIAAGEVQLDSSTPGGTAGVGSLTRDAQRTRVTAARASNLLSSLQQTDA